MIFQRVNQSDPEKIFISVYNSYSTASLTSGQVAMWDYATDANGVSVTKPAASVSAGAAVAGVAVQTIAAGAYGLIQVYGYNSSTRCRTLTGGTPAIAAGVPLGMQTANFCLESIDTGSTNLMVAVAAIAFAANATFTTAAQAVFLKCL